MFISNRSTFRKHVESVSKPKTCGGAKTDLNGTGKLVQYEHLYVATAPSLRESIQPVHHPFQHVLFRFQHHLLYRTVGRRAKRSFLRTDTHFNFHCVFPSSVICIHPPVLSIALLTENRLLGHCRLLKVNGNRYHHDRRCTLWGCLLLIVPSRENMLWQ